MPFVSECFLEKLIVRKWQLARWIERFHFEAILIIDYGTHLTIVFQLANQLTIQCNKETGGKNKQGELATRPQAR